MQKQLREENLPKRSFPDSAVEEDTSFSNTWKCQFCSFFNQPENQSCKSCLKMKNDANNLPKLSELFRPKSGSWECKACYSVNGSKDNTCVCCDSPKEKPKSPGPVSPSPVSKEKTPTPLSELFKPKTGSWECAECLVRNDGDKTICLACSTPKPGYEKDVKESPKTPSLFNYNFQSDGKDTGFTFGIKSSESNNASKSSFTFGAQPASKAVESSGGEDSSKTKPPLTGFTFGQTSNTQAATPFSYLSRGDVVPSSADSTSSTKPQGAMFKFGHTPKSSEASFTFGSPALPSSSTGNKCQVLFSSVNTFTAENLLKFSHAKHFFHEKVYFTLE